MNEVVAPEDVEAPLSVLWRFAIGRSIGSVGRSMLSVAVGYELYERTHSAVTLGLVGAVQLVPVLALFIPGGVVADRFDRRKLCAWTMAATALGCLLLAGASYEALAVASFYAVLFWLGAAGAVQQPASSALLPMLVARSQLAKANGIRTTAYELASILGPAAAGLLLGFVSPAVVYVLAAVLCAASAVAFLMLPQPRAQATRAGGPSRSSKDLWVGLRFIFRSRLLLPALTLDMVAVLFAGATALLPVFAKDVLDVGPQGLGLLRAAPALGAASMALIGTRLPPWKKPGLVLLIVVAGYGVATVGFGLSHTFWLSLVLLGFSGVLDNISVIIRLTLEQVVVPDEIRGRVGAVHYVFIGMSNELGELESGLAAAWLGAIPAVVAGGVIAIVWAGVVAGVWPELVRSKPLHELRPQTD